MDRMKELEKKIWAGTASIAESKEYIKLWNEREKLYSQHKSEVSRDMRLRRRRGKDDERRIAKQLGMKREGGVGMRDVGNSMFSIEVKRVTKIPASIDKILSQAIRLAKNGTIPLGVFKCGRRTVYIIEGNHWLELHGKENEIG